jgi:plasmid maintenance system antidote protein VapI
LESNSANGKITFAVLRNRLISLVNTRIQNGHFSERGLARMLGISQPQMHNVLKGARKLRPELADRLVTSLEITVADLFETAELREQLALRSAESTGHFESWNAGSEEFDPEVWNRRAVPKKPLLAEVPTSRSDKQQAS